MDEQLEILLNKYQNIASVNIDSFNKIELENNLTEINEYDIRNIVSATEVFDAERAASEVYRIYGRIEFMSLLNGLKSDYKHFPDFFSPQKTNSKNILNSFDFYLVRPASSGYTHLSGGTSGMIIDEKFDNWITASPTNYPVGWVAPTPTVGSHIEQTGTNQAKFVLGNSGFINLVSIYKDIPPVYGNLLIRTNVDILPNLTIGTDLMPIILASNGTAITGFQLLSGGTGYKEYSVTIPQSTPITRVTIMANSTNKNIFMDYLQIEKTDADLGTNNSTITYNRYFEVIATPSQFDLFPAGFSNNVFGEQTYTYDFNVDINISPFQDNFGFPITELFLYAQYKKSVYPAPAEILSAKMWEANGTISEQTIITKSLNVGDIVQSLNNQKFGDIVDYSELEYLQVQTYPELFYITTPYSGETITYTGIFNQHKVVTPIYSRLMWLYNPFIPLRLRYFTDTIYQANISGTSYEQVQSIPYFATELQGGNYVWRDIMPEGYRDPLTGLGNDLPFINKRRYLFTSIVLDVIPDLNDTATLAAFSEVWFGRNAYNFNTTPTGDVNNIGKPCQ